MTAGLDRLSAAYDDPAAVVAQALAAGRRPIRTLGTDAPREYLIAAGFQPVRLSPGPARPTPRADAAMGAKGLGVRCRRLIEQILESQVPILITAGDAEQAQLFAVLRELARLGEENLPSIHLLDLVHIDRAASLAYNRSRLDRLGTWLETLDGVRPDSAQLAGAIGATARQAAALTRIGSWRQDAEGPRISGTDMLKIVASAAMLPLQDLEEALLAAEPNAPLPGHRVFITGTAHENPAIYALVESLGAVIVGAEHGYATIEVPAASGDPLDALADPLLRTSPAVTFAASRAVAVAAEIARCRPSHVLHLTIGDDEAAPWDIAAIRRVLPEGLPCLALKMPLDGDTPGTEAIAHFLAGTSAPAPAPKPATASPSKSAPRPQRSRKSLCSVADFGTYQREWFAGVRDQVAGGAPFAVVNANSPQEIFRALDIPFVVNQWWAAIVAAKQQSRRYMGLLKDRNFPTHVEAYSAQGLAATFDEDADLAPWGGLPKPDFVHAITSSDPTAKIYGEWAQASGAQPYLYARTVDPRMDIPVEWWEIMPDGWDSGLEADRLDLMTAELREAITALETATGRTFSHDRFVEIMDLVNEQEDYYRRTRDLIARTVPAPIGIVDSMPATMVPQWHRGTVWARDAAKAFYEEVLARVASGASAIPNERVRLMFVGRGMWSDMAFYQQWEESHGAVFVWSMYLALAADGYIRHFDRDCLDGPRNPLRALAARFLTMGDELRMPSWAAPWHVHEARSHSIDGAVALSDADPFVLRALERAGIPVLDLGIDNFSSDAHDTGAINARVAAFIEGPAGARAEARRRNA